ncbi:MAG: hypothetical protein PUC18_03120 [Prevotellaceae bacterium]|nr:hypothetical protein [Prevotellaceae bacterium]
MVKRFLVSLSALLVLALSISSCKNNDDVAKWVGRTIVFPKNMVFTKYSNDTVSFEMNKEYKVLTYISEDDCFPCVLNKLDWTDLMNEVDSVSHHHVSYIFVVHPSDVKTLVNFQRNYSFDLPVFVDIMDSVNILNEFPASSMMHSFLLDNDNKVVLVGQPILNNRIRDLYIKTIESVFQ